MAFDLDNEQTISVLDEVPLWSAPFGLKLLDTIRMNNVSKILDIGSGLGFPAVELAMRYGDQTQVYALDPWAAGNFRTNWKAEITGITNLTVIPGKAEEMPFEDATFDLIVSNNGLNNVQDLPKTISECRRVAKKNSQFVFTMNTDETMVEFYSVFRSALTERNMRDELRKLEQHIRDKRKPLAVIEVMLEEAGFNLVNKFLDSFRFRYANGSTMLRHFTIRTSFLEPWKEILTAGMQQPIMEEIEERLNRIASKRGELVLTIPYVTYEYAPYPF